MTRQRSKNAFFPRLETLEDRLTPAVRMTSSGTTLRLIGNRLPDQVTVVDNGDGDLRVSFSGGMFRGDNLRRIQFNLGEGHDRFTYRQTGNRTRSMLLSGSLGSGHDMFTAHIQGGVTFLNTLDFLVRGDSGLDSLRVVADSGVDIQLGALMRVELFGGNDRDQVDFNYQGKLDGTLRYRLDGQGGNDNGTGFVRATIRANADSFGQIGIVGEAARVAGGSGSDSLSHFVFKDPNDRFLEVFAVVDGGLFSFPSITAGRRDVCNRTANVSSFGCAFDFIT
jgi:hypothetical protein